MLRYATGTLGMALSGPDTGGGQFFITHSPQPHLDGGYTVFGRVRAGMEAVERVVQEEPIIGMRTLR
jgi:cyclophilin family peptidyl-prolyl cis-trans isomerase